MTETKPAFPAILGALATLMLAMLTGALLLLSHPNPDQIKVNDQSKPLNLSTMAEALGRGVSGRECNDGLDRFIGVNCHMGPVAALARAAWEGPNTRLKWQTLPLAALVGSIVAFMSIYGRTAKRELERSSNDRQRPRFDADARKSLREAIAKSGRPGARNLWLVPHVQLSPAAETRNMLALGTHGSGKSSLLRALIVQAIARGDMVFIHDVKGDMTAGLPVENFILLAPHDARSWAYDIAADIRNRNHALELAMRAIEASPHDPMWGKGAQGIFADLTVGLARETNGAWFWPDLARVLLSPGAEIRARLMAHGSLSASRLIFDSADPEENRTAMSLLITLWVAAMTVILPLAEAWAEVPAERRFSLTKWVEGNPALPQVIVLQRSSEYAALSNGVGAFIFDRLAALAMSPGRPRYPAQRLVLALDELPEMGRLERITSLLNTGRELGLVTLAGLQDIPHLIDIYGEQQAHVLLARFGIKAIHQVDAGDTANRVEAMLGEREVFLPHPSEINPKTGKPLLERQRIPIFSAYQASNELGIQYEDGRKVARMLFVGLGSPAIVNVPITAWPEKRKSHEPAAWLNTLPNGEA